MTHDVQILPDYVASESTLFPPSFFIRCITSWRAISFEIMTMHPELEDAFDTGLSMSEVFKLFTKHHSGPIEKRIETDPFKFEKLDHNNDTFWDKWSPLFRCLQYTLWMSFVPVDEPFMNIHKALTREIILWLCDSKKKSNIYLISETLTSTRRTGHGYTRAHIFANVCYDAQRFGLPMRNRVYYQRGNINSLIGELAAHYPSYRRILARELIDNPGILKLSTRTRFRQLIHEPWQALQGCHPQSVIPPPVVVLRWASKALDDEFLCSILEFGSSPHSSSLLWIISIDSNIKLPIQDLLHPSVPFQYYRLPVCYEDTLVDAALILHYQFSVLRCRHKEMFDKDEVWPSEEERQFMEKISPPLTLYLTGVCQLERGDSDIVRVEPVSFSDRQFIDKCQGLAEQLELEHMQVPQDSKEFKEWVLLHVMKPKYVLLGFGDETVLAVLATREGYDRWNSGVHIYTSAMLHYM
ncbi:hypothetical protein Agabi119p4_6100 [Agaricus bisporus var. burnettii]|uniref:Uncharacterized protein n=1 Tax=Agaricus bisporus var. burnettii TaxID=192524 RepID=A0A8H7F179_AGABI|nr:hypothetical protein Agabi119p4_6100 [Agaricus bisporus var. burnettii]